MTHIVWVLLLLAVARSVFLSWSGATRLNDPFSAIFAIGDAISSAVGGLGLGAAADVGATAAGAGLADVGAAAAGAGLADVGAAAGAGLADVGATAAGAGLADVGAGAGLGAAGDVLGSVGAADALSSIAPIAENLATGGGFVGGGVGDLATTAAGGLTSPVSGASALSSVAPAGSAAIPSTVAPPAEFLAADTSFTGGASGPTVGLGTESATAAPAATATGPVAGASPADTSLLDVGTRGPSMTGSFTAAGDPTGFDYGGGSDAGATPGGGIRNFLKENKDLLSLGGAVLPLAQMLFKGNPPLPGEAAASQLAGSTGAAGEALQSAAVSGVLPQGFEEAIVRAKTANAATIKSEYAAKGQSGSTSEAMDIVASNAKVDASRAQLLDQLMGQGIAATGQAGAQDIQLAQLQLAQDQELQKALSTLAGNLVLSTLPARTTATA